MTKSPHTAELPPNEVFILTFDDTAGEKSVVGAYRSFDGAKAEARDEYEMESEWKEENTDYWVAWDGNSTTMTIGRYDIEGSP